MPHLDCPWCTGELTPDETWTTASCDDCRITIDVAPDPQPSVLDAAA
jgi:hypothetical protein